MIRQESEAVRLEKLWGGETDKAIDNFPISGERVPLPVIHWLARIKGAAATVNARLGKLDASIAGAIENAAEAVAAGRYDDQFPIDVFQTGSGTSSNMNANEVIASICARNGVTVHPNDDVNMSQSSNDVFPSAVHLAALDQSVNSLLPALTQLEKALDRKARAEIEDVARRVEKVETAVEPRFQEHFVAAMAIPEVNRLVNAFFAGAKEVAVIDAYEKQLGLDRFDRLIDWGWFYFITKPMFFMLDWFFRLFGNFLGHEVAVIALVHQHGRGLAVAYGPLDGLAIGVVDLERIVSQHRPVAILQIADFF